MSFYDPEGLKTIALLLDDLLEVQKPYSQNHLAELAGISPNTIKKIRSNRVAYQHKPDPDTILALARYVPNPLTGEAFTEEDFLQVARGQLKVPLLGKFQGTEEDVVPDPPLVEFLKRQMRERGQDEAAFARAAKLTAEELREILQGRIPSWIELLKLGSYLFPDKNPAPMLRLLGIDPSSPVDQKPDHATNGC